jgi:hypothetical protein
MYEVLFFRLRENPGSDENTNNSLKGISVIGENQVWYK